MNSLLAAKEYLNKVLNEKLNFSDAQKEISKNPSYEGYGATIKNILGSELRHHRYIVYLFKPYSEGFTELEKYLIYVSLADKFFVKKYDVKEIKSILKEELKDKYSEDLERIFDFDGSIYELDANKIKKDDDEYFAARFNIPDYLFKMWKRNYGVSTTFKILKKNSKKTNQYLRVLPTTSIEKLKADLKDKIKETKDKDLFLYDSKESIKSLNAYKHHLFFLEKPAIKDLMNKVFSKDIEEMTIYSGEDDSIFREARVLAESRIGIHYAVPTFETRVAIMNLLRIEKEQSKNIHFFEVSDLSGLDAHISNKQDLVVVYPKSSSFERIRQYPDYLIQFDQNSLDELIANQKVALEELSLKVNNGGKLLYLVDTLDKKESSSLIKEFLAKHNEFILEEERQIFPFDEEDIALYYAIMYRKEEVND